MNIKTQKPHQKKKKSATWYGFLTLALSIKTNGFIYNVWETKNEFQFMLDINYKLFYL